LRQNKVGFSLIEAIVALVILSLFFSAMWAWFATATKSTSSIERLVALPDIYEQFMVNLALQDLNTTPQGTFVMGDVELTWQAKVIRRSDQESYRRQPAWIVTLYEVDVVVSTNGREVTTFATKTVRQYPDPTYIDIPS
jgi:type II secretory pathway pseudopilin PulG